MLRYTSNISHVDRREAISTEHTAWIHFQSPFLKQFFFLILDWFVDPNLRKIKNSFLRHGYETGG